MFLACLLDGYLNDVHYLDTQAESSNVLLPDSKRLPLLCLCDSDLHCSKLCQAATPTWTTPSISGTSPTGRERFAAVMDSSGKIWIFGGTDGSSELSKPTIP